MSLGFEMLNCSVYDTLFTDREQLAASIYLPSVTLDQHWLTLFTKRIVGHAVSSYESVASVQPQEETLTSTVWN